MPGQYSQRAFDTRQGFLPSSAIKYLALDAINRTQIIYRYFFWSSMWFLVLAPKASASPATAQVSPNSTDSTTTNDVDYLVSLFSWRKWRGTANDIRNGVDRKQCLANLSLALSAFGPLVNAETSGSSGALTLLPTAGALIGAPTKELWVVYKLMPLAGILSMLLSLGGNIVPTEANDYELNSSAFSYGGMIATSNKEQEVDEMEDRPALSGAQAFAAKVDVRSQDMRGGTKYVRVWYGIVLQILWLGVLLGACWFTQSGSILVWWCKVRGPACYEFFPRRYADDFHRRGVGCSSGTS